MLNGWFPVHPEHYARIRSKFFRGAYQNARRELLDDLRGDGSLYLLCLRELARLLRAKSRELDTSTLSLEKADDELLRQALTAVMAGDALKLSAHSLENMSVLQQFRLEELLMSTVAVETIAPHVGLSADVGYSCALLRQLGVTLLAWNYPHVYAQAFQAVQKSERGTGEDFDSAIHSMLGFSPAMLAARIVEEWGADAELIGIVQNRASARTEASRSGSRLTIGQLCRIGEAFSRANAPERYPSARDDWRCAAPAIREHLGAQGFHEVFQRIRAVAGGYADYCPQLFSTLDRREQTASTMLRNGESLSEINAFISSCSAEIRKLFIEFYEQQREGIPLEVVLRSLVDQLLPQLGCAGIAILSLDPTSQQLVPVLARGRIATTRIKPLGLQDEISRLHPARLAFLQRSVVEERGRCGKSDRCLFAGSIGFNKRAAVLIAEWELTAVLAGSPGETAAVFQALRTCITNLLGLE